jgi:hypothetical protein
MEDYLIEFGAPTLASLKVGSLFNYAYTSTGEMICQIAALNGQLGDKGVVLRLLRLRGGRALIYLYRTSQLETVLNRPEIQAFLRGYGYSDCSVAAVLWHLQCRLQDTESFPHEIGVFLGYPLEDVVGFIRCKGCDYKCSGLWKVYGDAQQAQRCFALYARCRSVYRRLWHQGRSVPQLTVAV